MISYAEAKKRALDARPEYDYCTVRKDAYVFSCSKDEMCAGGPDAPIVILKEDGRALNFTGYIYDHLSEEDLDSFKLGSEKEKKYLEGESSL
ncbi:MAG: hypothetical protein ACOX1H_00555 [Pseudoramibacter sp.]|jgi:hypothetical protein